MNLTEEEITYIFENLNIEYTNHSNYFKFKCISPMHQDNKPSMTMLKSNGYCRCWSCGATYTFNRFLKEVTGESIDKFVDMKKIHNRQFFTPALKKKAYKKEQQFHIKKGEILDPIYNPQVSMFLEKMYVNRDLIKKFNIGYIDEAILGFDLDKKGTYIRNRITIPVFENGKMVNIELRDFTGKQTPKVLYPKGSKADLLWNYDNIDLNKPLVVVEGIKSALRIYRFVTDNVVSTFGSSIGNNQKELLSNIPYMILFSDNDEAGDGMIEQIDPIMNYDYKIARMPIRGQDPGDGKLEELMYAMNNTKESVDVLFERHNISLEESKVTW